MSQFEIPASALRAAELAEAAREAEEAARAAKVVEEEKPRAPMLGGYAGFVCFECRCPVDVHLRGEHAPGCSLAMHNESLLPGAEKFAKFIQHPVVTGIYHGKDPTETERESGTEIELENTGPLKPNGAGHRALAVFAGGDRLTAYDASHLAAGDYHALRREARRLHDRGFLVKDGTLPNRAARGRPHVDAYRITPEGVEELERLHG